MNANKFPELGPNRLALGWDSLLHAILQWLKIENKPFTDDKVFSEFPEEKKY